MTSTKAYDVFLSHNSEDKLAVEVLARRLLEDAGIQPFLDRWHLIPGKPWQEAIEEALAQSETVAVFVGPSGISPWHNEEMRAALDDAVRSRDEVRVIPVLLPGADEDSVSRFLARRTWVDFRAGLDDTEAFERLVAGIKGEAVHIGTYELPDEPAPYRGLLRFEAEHSRFFFGRDEERQRLAKRLKQDNFVALVGASGSGKSSLARAGLLPALADDTPLTNSKWHILTFTPGSQPLHSLACQLATLAPPTADRLETADQLARRLAERADGVRTATMAYLADCPQPVLLFVDQFEELFTLCREGPERCRAQAEQLIANLADAVEHGDGQIRVLITLRADFLDRCLDFPALRELLENHQVLIGPMDETALREAIVRPAQEVGAFFEKGLVSMILRDVQAEPGALPLLEHALHELWLARRGPWLTIDAYEASGGVQGALQRRAQATYKALSPAQQQIARNVLLRLTALGEGVADTRRRVERAELYPVGVQPLQVDLVIQALSGPDARLVVADVQSVEVAHEALIQNWSTLRHWLEDDRDALRLHRHLTESAEDWDDLGRDTGELYRGARLAQATEWAGANSDVMSRLERDFLDASQAAAMRSARRRRAVIAGFAALIVAALVIVLLLQGDRAREQEAFAETQATARATAELLAAEAQAAAATAQAAATDEAEALDIALTRQVEAEEARDMAQQQHRLALSRALADQAAYYRTSDPQLALLLATNAVSSTYGVDGYATLQATTALRQALKLYLPVATLVGHTRTVQWAGFSPDGQRLVTAGIDGTARIWDAKTGEELAVLEGHGGDVKWAGFSPDGQRIATASMDQTARLWDVASALALGQAEGLEAGPPGGEEPAVLEGHKLEVSWAAFSPDGQRLATASTDHTARIWDTATGQELRILGAGHSSGLRWAAFDPTGLRVLTTGDDGTARVWDVSAALDPGTVTGPDTSAAKVRQLAVLEGYTVHWAEFSPDGQRVVAVSADNTARIWNATTGDELAVLKGHTGDVFSAKFSPSGERVVTVSADNTARIWDAASGEELAVSQGPGWGIASASFSPDGQRIATVQEGSGWAIPPASSSPGGQRIATAPWSSTVHIWDAETGTVLAMLEGHQGDVVTAEFSPDGQRIVTASRDDTARIWNAVTGQELAVLEGHVGDVVWAGFSPDGQRAASMSNDGTAIVWDAGTGAVLAVLEGHDGGLVRAEFSPDGQGIVTASRDDTARIWDAVTGQELAVLEGHVGDIVWAGFSPDGQHVLTAGSDGTARLWDAGTGERLALLGMGSVYHLAFSPDGQYLITSGSDRTAHIWDAVAGEEVALLEGHTGTVNWAEFSPDGQRIVTASRDRTARIWDATTGRQRAVLQAHISGVQWAEFSPDGQRIVTAGNDSRAYLWDAETGQELEVLEGHKRGLWQAAFSPDGRYVVTASADQTARIWDAATGQALALLQAHTDDVRWARFSPDGQNIVTASSDGTARIWARTVPFHGSMAGHGAPVFFAEFDPSGRWVASAGQDGVARIWNAETGEEVATLEGHGEGLQATEEGCPQCINVITFSPSGSQVATAGWDGTARLWSVPDGEALAVLQAHTGPITDVAFDPTGTLLATSSSEVHVWEVASGSVLSTLWTSGNYLDFSPDGRQLAVAGSDGRVRIWDVASGEEAAIFEGDGITLIRVVFSPDGRRVAAAGQGATGYVWDLESGQQTAALQGHTETIWQVTYSPQGDMLATASEDGTAALWDAKTGQRLHVLSGHQVAVRSVAFRPDGRQVATGGADGMVRLWATDTGEMEATLPEYVGAEVTAEWLFDEETHTLTSDEPPDWVLWVNYHPSGDRLVAASLDGLVSIYVTAVGKLLEIAESQSSQQLTCEERVRFLYEDLDCSVPFTPTLGSPPISPVPSDQP